MKIVPYFFASAIPPILLALAPAVLSGQTNFTGASGDRFGIAGNWTNGVPSAGNPGTVNNARVEIATAVEMDTGATVTFSGASSLERNSAAFAWFSNTLNINGSTNVKISSLWPATGSVLNWNSTGTFSIADAGPDPTQARLLVATTRDVTININAGFWDMRGNGNPASVHFNHGTFNMNGGLLIADRRFRIGSGETSATLNYAADAEIRAANFGTFSDSVFEFEPGATLFLESGLLGSFGTEGFEWFRDEMRKGVDSSIHIKGVGHQSLTLTQSWTDNPFFVYDTVELDGIWYNSISAIPEPRVYAAFFGLIALVFVVYTRRRHS